MLVIFPFEEALYRDAGVNVQFVGHPLVDLAKSGQPRDAFLTERGLVPASPTVALLPGSRRSEIQYIAPRLLEAASHLQRQRPALRFVLPVVPGLRGMVMPLVAAHAGGAHVQLVDGHSHEALAACDELAMASGTATLEAALFKRPMVIAYNMNWISWQIMRRQRLQPWVGLPNILCGDFVVPELLQDEASPPRLAQAVLDWLDDPGRVQALQARFVQLHHELRRDTAALATDAIETLLAR